MERLQLASGRQITMGITQMHLIIVIHHEAKSLSVFSIFCKQVTSLFIPSLYCNQVNFPLLPLWLIYPLYISHTSLQDPALAFLFLITHYQYLDW